MAEDWWLTELEVAEFGPSHPLWPTFVREAEALAHEDDGLDWELPLPGRHHSITGSVRLRAWVKAPSEGAAITRLHSVIRRAGHATDAAGVIYTTLMGPNWEADHGHAERE